MKASVFGAATLAVAWAGPLQAQVVAPQALNPGAQVSPVPNGFVPTFTKPFDSSVSFDFVGGPAGILRERVLKFSDTSPAPYNGGGLLFDYEITLSSGDITEFSVGGYSGIWASVKQCGIPGCTGSGADGVPTTGASRTPDGNWISFFFDSDLSGTAHSANMQLLTDVTSFIDPPATLRDAMGDVFSLSIVGPAPIPEPSTWAMILLGFAGLGFAYRRVPTRASARPSAPLGIISEPT